MKTLILIVLLASPFLSHAQRDSTMYGYVDSVTFREAFIPPVYPGGPSNWNRYVKKYLKYPRSAERNNITGVVVVEFTVDKGGNVSDVKVAHAIDPALDQEAVRLIKDSRLWAPAAGPGGTVVYRTRQKVEFRLDE